MQCVLVYIQCAFEHATKESKRVFWLFPCNRGLLRRDDLWTLENLVEAAIGTIWNLIGDWTYPFFPPLKWHKLNIKEFRNSTGRNVSLSKYQGLGLVSWFLCNWMKLPGWDSDVIGCGLDHCLVQRKQACPILWQLQLMREGKSRRKYGRLLNIKEGQSSAISTGWLNSKYGWN